MGPSQICGCPFREPRVFTIAHIYIYIDRWWLIGISHQEWPTNSGELSQTKLRIPCIYHILVDCVTIFTGDFHSPIGYVHEHLDPKGPLLIEFGTISDTAGWLGFSSNGWFAGISLSTYSLLDLDDWRHIRLGDFPAMLDDQMIKSRFLVPIPSPSFIVWCSPCLLVSISRFLLVIAFPFQVVK